MLDIADGAIRAYYLFDVADTIDLAKMSALGSDRRAPAALPLRSDAPPYLQFPVPPVVVNLPEAGFDGLRCSLRVKFYDYGVISLRLSFPAAGSWNDVVALTEKARSDERIARFAQATAMRICDEYAEALDERHAALVEDYLIVEIERFTDVLGGDALLRDHSSALAGLLLGERRALSTTETAEALRVRFSYYEDDLTIVQWDTAIVYDRGKSARAIEEILEFANSQLLELRTYDALLDSELDTIYKMQPGEPSRSLRGRREAEQAATLRYLIVDVLELTDRSSNALKVLGDAYYARIYRAAAARLGLADWQRQIDTKLASVGEMYRFFNDEARSRRDEFLELIIIVLIAFEVLIGILTLLHL
ncbi:MAG: hypothetical protein JO347_00910 [Candidatus Eremiobacteraeota bacterium]|nr:hypothetical protein [Candidatus Eremiobacteraeota bacterium]